MKRTASILNLCRQVQHYDDFGELGLKLAAFAIAPRADAPLFLRKRRDLEPKCVHLAPMHLLFVPPASLCVRMIDSETDVLAADADTCRPCCLTAQRGSRADACKRPKQAIDDAEPALLE